MKKVRSSYVYGAPLLNLKQSETLSVPSRALVEKNGYVVESSSFGSKGPINVSFPDYLPLYLSPYLSLTRCF